MNRHPLQIFADGINQMILTSAPADSIARLRGAMEYCRATGTVLRDETIASRKTASAPVIETIPPAPELAAEVE